MLALPLAKKLRTAGRVLREGGTAEAWALVTSNFQAAIHTLPGGLIRAGTQRFRASDAVTRERLLNGDYELPERFAVKRYLRPSTPVVELGASLGVVSCAINRRLSNPERHVAVEANPAVLPILTGNRDLNGCRFEIVHAAAGAEGDVITFYIGGG